MMLRLFFAFLLILVVMPASYSHEGGTLSAGISMNSVVPTDLMGTWRVVSKLIETNSPENFKEVGVVIWNLSRRGDVISLCNPFTGAQAFVNVEYVKNNTVKFSKEGNYEDTNLIDSVEITINGDTFSGENYLIMKEVSPLRDNTKPEKRATYAVSGKRIFGNGIME